MADDLVKRLREARDSGRGNGGHRELCGEAADEMERLQKAITNAMYAISNGHEEEGGRILRECFWGTEKINEMPAS